MTILRMRRLPLVGFGWMKLVGWRRMELVGVGWGKLVGSDGWSRLLRGGALGSRITAPPVRFRLGRRATVATSRIPARLTIPRTYRPAPASRPAPTEFPRPARLRPPDQPRSCSVKPGTWGLKGWVAWSGPGAPAPTRLTPPPESRLSTLGWPLWGGRERSSGASEQLCFGLTAARPVAYIGGAAGRIGEAARTEHRPRVSDATRGVAP